MTLLMVSHSTKSFCFIGEFNYTHLITHCAWTFRVTPVLVAQQVKMVLLDQEVSPEKEVCLALWLVLASQIGRAHV